MDYDALIDKYDKQVESFKTKNDELHKTAITTDDEDTMLGAIKEAQELVAPYNVAIRMKDMLEARKAKAESGEVVPAG